jgi:alkylhydroperoxidase/carboxymuconolactone decarboxylase family protein YurZ
VPRHRTELHVTASSRTATLGDLREEALRLTEDLEAGEELDPRSVALIALAVQVSATTLAAESIEALAEDALDAGATAAEVHETIVLVSGIGVHSLFEGSRALAEVLRRRGDPGLDAPLDEARLELRRRWIGEDPYWSYVEAEVPGFLDALLRLSPPAFEAFLAYCAVPWKTAALRALTKELIALASDATASHRYTPGMRLHIGNAIRLGAGRRQILTALDIAASAPPHRGVK